jgi:bifunctional DNA-binding transcriptional regulator/antitoxin component of YhaV-PrlF toxin-antitoxin module
MWSRKLRTWGRQNIAVFPKEAIDKLGWKTNDTLLITLTGRNIATFTRVDARIVPEALLSKVKDTKRAYAKR